MLIVLTWIVIQKIVVTSKGKERKIYQNPNPNHAGGVAVDDHGDLYVTWRLSDNSHRLSNEG